MTLAYGIASLSEDLIRKSANILKMPVEEIAKILKDSRGSTTFIAKLLLPEYVTLLLCKSDAKRKKSVGEINKAYVAAFKMLCKMVVANLTMDNKESPYRPNLMQNDGLNLFEAAFGESDNSLTESEQGSLVTHFGQLLGVSGFRYKDYYACVSQVSFDSAASGSKLSINAQDHRKMLESALKESVKFMRLSLKQPTAKKVRKLPVLGQRKSPTNPSQNTEQIVTSVREKDMVRSTTTS